MSVFPPANGNEVLWQELQLACKIGTISALNFILYKEPPRSIGEAIIKIKELTGIERKTGHIPAKVNNTEQHNWVEETLKPVIKAAQDGEVHLLFMDAAHFVLQPFPTLVV